MYGYGYLSLDEQINMYKTVSDSLMPLGLEWARALLLVVILRQHWLVLEVTELSIRQESHL